MYSLKLIFVLLLVVSVELVFSAPYSQDELNAERIAIQNELKEIPEAKHKNALVNKVIVARCQKYDEIKKQGVLKREKDYFKKAAFAELGMNILQAFVNQVKQHVNSKLSFEPIVQGNDAVWVFLVKNPTDPLVIQFRKMFPKNWTIKFIANLCSNSFQKLKNISTSSKIQMQFDVSDFIILCGPCLSASEKKCIINVANFVEPPILLTNFA